MVLLNRFWLTLFQVTVRTIHGRMCLFCMGCIQAEDCESVTWLLTQLKRFITPEDGADSSPNEISSHGTYSFITPVRTLLAQSYLRLDAWHLHRNIARNVASFSGTSRGVHVLTVMKKEVLLLMDAKNVHDFYRYRVVLKNK